MFGGTIADVIRVILFPRAGQDWQGGTVHYPSGKGWARIWTVENVLPSDTCSRWISIAEDRVWDRHGIGEDEPATRDSTKARVEIDWLFPTIKSILPATICGRRILRIPQERMIFIRYGVGDRFDVHTDAPYVPGPRSKSMYTLMLYLNDNFEGGETRFPGLGRVISPRRGMALIFPHRVRHEGLPLISGTKYALHTFIIYGTT